MPKQITDTQIETLRAEAIAAQDVKQIAICDLALEGVVDVFEYALTRDEALDVDAMSRRTARAACARVIAEAQDARPGLWPSDAVAAHLGVKL